MSMISTQGSLLRPCKKSRENCSFDFLSNLHENLLSQILSRLPTKDAVQTSILSKDWMYKWTCIYHIDIMHSRADDTEYFVNFVDKMLLNASYLKSFRFVCYQYKDVNHFVTWICDLLSRENIESVDVSYYGPPIDLHWCPHERSSLKNLKLDFRGTFNVATLSSFRNLQSFCLHDIQIHSGNSESDTLILKFPVLEVFVVKKCEWVNVKFVKIYAPMLNTYMSRSSYLNRPNNCSIEIIGAKISTYECEGGLPENVILTGSQVVSCLDMNNEDPADGVEFVLKNIGLQVWKLLNDSPSLIELKLSDFLFLALQSAPPIRLHDKLRRLCLHHHPINIEQLFDLLHAAPSLNFLSLNVASWGKYDYDAMAVVPACVVSRLEEVELARIRDKSSQYKLLKFLLKNCGALKKLTFKRTILKVKHIAKKLLKFPRISNGLGVVVLNSKGLPSSLVVL